MCFSCTKEKPEEKITPTPEVTQFTPSTGTTGTSVTITGKNFSTTASQN
jgi:hypothetical protein